MSWWKDTGRALGDALRERRRIDLFRSDLIAWDPTILPLSFADDPTLDGFYHVGLRMEP